MGLMNGKRQFLRRAFGLLSLALLPVTLYYLSPVVPLGGIAQGVIAGSLLVFGALFLSSLFVGRVFCGWICPVGAFQDLLRIPRDAPRVPTTRLAIARFVLFGAWIIGVALLLARYGVPRRLDLFFMTNRGVSVTDGTSVIVLLSILTLFGLLTILLGRRGGCRSLCWIAPFMQAGTALGRRLHLPQLSLIPDKRRGTANRACATVCPMALNPYRVAAAARHNGPGYQRTECILCGRCVDHCGAGLRLGWTRPGTGRVADGGRSPRRGSATTLGTPALVALVIAGVLLPGRAAALEVAPADPTRQEDQELALAWGWEGDPALAIRFTHSPVRPFLVRWLGSVPLTDNRELFAPGVGFGLGITNGMRPGRTDTLALAVDARWAWRSYADETSGIAAVSAEISWYHRIHPESGSSVGVVLSTEIPVWTDTPGATVDGTDAALRCGIIARNRSWGLLLGAAWRDGDYRAAFGGSSQTDITGVFSLCYATDP